MKASYRNLHNAPPWRAHQPAKFGARITNASKAYECTRAGTTGTAGPSTSGTVIVDGSATWKYLSEATYGSNFAAWATAIRGRPTVENVLLLWNDLPGTPWNVGAAENGAVNAGWTLTGVTTSPTTGVTIRCAPGESFSDHPNRANHRLGAPNANYGVFLFTNSGYAALYVGGGVNHFTCNGLQVRSTSGGHGAAGITSRATNTTITNFVGWCPPGDDGTNLNMYPSASNGIVLVSNFFSVGSHDGNTGLAFFHCGDGATAEMGTFIQPADYPPGALRQPRGTPGVTEVGPLHVSYGTHNMTVRNCAFFGSRYDSYPGNLDNWVADGHNASDLGPFSGPKVGQVINVPFTTATFRGVVSSDLDARLAAGPNRLLRAGSSSVSTNKDIFGNARPAGSFDIGCFQLSKSTRADITLPLIGLGMLAAENPVEQRRGLFRLFARAAAWVLRW